MERSAWRRQAQESSRPRGADRSVVVGDRGIAGPGSAAAIRREAYIKEAGGHRDATATRGCNGRRSRKRDRLAAAHGARPLLGNPEKLGLTLVSAKEERGRVYRIAVPEQA